MTRNLAWTAPLFACAVAAQSPDPAPPRYTVGNLAALECKVVDARAVPDGLQVLTVDVHNRGAVGAEPLEFTIELPARKPAPALRETFVRLQLPRARRHGRPAPASGKQTYRVSTALPGKKAQFVVRVASAVFYEGGAVAEPDLRIGKPEQVEVRNENVANPVTQVALHNPFDKDLDVLLLVTLKQPVDAVELFGARLPAGKRVEWRLTHRSGNGKHYCDQDYVVGTAMRATKFEVVDWSLVETATGSDAVELLRPAYEAWYRWPEADLPARGTFTFVERRARAGEPGTFDEARVQGRFVLPASGPAAVEITSGGGANAQPLLEEAFANVRRPEFGSLADRAKPQLVRTERVALPDASWHRRDAAARALSVAGAQPVAEDLEVRDGRIVSDGRGDDTRTEWTTQPLGTGHLVTRRRGANTDTTYTYAERSDRIVPAGVSTTTTYGGALFSAAELLLTDVAFDVGPPLVRAAPSGAGVDTLRAAWERPYRLPGEAVTFSARFEVQNAGDGVWQGQRSLHGTVRMRGVGRDMQHAEFTFDGDLSEAMQLAMAGTIRDRLLAWYGRDFNDRPPFDDFFSGATVGAPSPDGNIAIERGPVATVFTDGGLVRGWRYADGSTRSSAYQTIGDRQCVAKIEESVGTTRSRSQDRWQTTVHVTLAPCGPHLLPASLRLERVFGRDWGPETLTFRNAKIEGS